LSSRFVIAIAAALALVAAAAAAEAPGKRAGTRTLAAPMALLPPPRSLPPRHAPTARPAPATLQEVAAADAAPAKLAPLARPMPGNRLVHETSGARLCIGGVMCTAFCAERAHACTPTMAFTIKLDKPARIDTIQLSAHDDIGASRRSRLLVKVNGKKVGSTLVYRLGSTLSLDVNATGEMITIESAHQYNGFLRGGEEAVVWDVYVFGEERS